MESRHNKASIPLRNGRGDAVGQVVGVVRRVGHHRDGRHGGGAQRRRTIGLELEDLKGASRADARIELQGHSSLEDRRVGSRPDHRQIALLVDRLDDPRPLESIFRILKTDIGGVSHHVRRHEQATFSEERAESLTGEGLFLQPRTADVWILDRGGDPQDGVCARDLRGLPPACPEGNEQGNG